MLYLPNLLLISGTGRNSGKTSLACAIIQKFAASGSLVAIKIAPHFHEQGQFETFTEKTPEYIITEETSKDTGKDSSRMLAAGAAKSYYITTHDVHILNAFEKLRSTFPASHSIICESGGLRNFVKPGIFFMVNHTSNNQIKPEAEKLRLLADYWITFDNMSFDFNISSLEIEEQTWKIKR